MTHPTYSEAYLESLPLARLKEIAAQLGTKATVDKRYKKSWVLVILRKQSEVVASVAPVAIDAEAEAIYAELDAEIGDVDEVVAPVAIEVVEVAPVMTIAGIGNKYTETTYQLVDVSSFTFGSLEKAANADRAKVQQIIDAAIQLGTLISPIVVKYAGIADCADSFDLVYGVEALSAAIELRAIDPRRFEMVGVTVVPGDADTQSIADQMPSESPVAQAIDTLGEWADAADYRPLERVAEAVAVVCAYLASGCLWADATALANRATEAIIAPLYRAIYQSEGSRRVWLRKCKQLVAAV